MFIIIPKFEFLNFSPKMPIEHTIVIIKQHTTTIQTLFSLIWTAQQEIKGNIFMHQTLSQHIFMNKQLFSKRKASWCSALKDLSKVYVNLRKWEGRIHTFFEGQFVFLRLFDIIEVQQLLNGPPDDEWWSSCALWMLGVKFNVQPLWCFWTWSWKMQDGVLEYKVLLCWMIIAWFQMQGLVLFNSLLTGLEEWPSEVNFVFFGGKAMLVPLCLDRRIRNAKAARWVRSCYVGLLASWFLKMQSKMAKVNFYVPPPIDAVWFLLMTGKWGVWSRVKCRVLVLLEFGNWFYCSW